MSPSNAKSASKNTLKQRPSIVSYVLTECLGKGGYASVWLGWRQGAMGFYAPVAIKVLDVEHARQEAAKRRFFAEARLLAELDHPNVVRVFDAGESRDRPYYVMEFVRSVSLATLLSRQSRLLPLDSTLHIAVRIASALHSAHIATDFQGASLDIVHRDVNPTNILIGPGGKVKLIDFGIAVSEMGPRETRVNVIKGTPRYLSPEQAFGLEVDPRSDIYSLALTLYETITGRAPLAAKTQADTLSLARDPHIAPPAYLRPAIPKTLDAAIMRALEREPDHRFSTMSEFALALQGCLAELNPTMMPESLERLLAGAPLPVAMPPSTGTMPMSGKTSKQSEPEEDTAVFERADTVPDGSSSIR